MGRTFEEHLRNLQEMSTFPEKKWNSLGTASADEIQTNEDKIKAIRIGHIHKHTK